MARIVTPVRIVSGAVLTARFRLGERGTTPRTEFIAGLTTFFTMAYIIFVNTDIMKATGMDPVALMIGTILAAAVPTLVMGLWADLPWALAPGMGYNALFAFTVVLGHQVPWPAALALVFLDGIAFTLIVSGPWARALFFVPLVGLVPAVATAPALLVVGFLMIEPVLKIGFTDVAEGLPAFLTLAVMPLTYSIADGHVRRHRQLCAAQTAHRARAGGESDHVGLRGAAAAGEDPRRRGEVARAGARAD